jgi:hypothetical protein
MFQGIRGFSTAYLLVTEGSIKDNSYGISLAEKAGLDTRVVMRNITLLNLVDSYLERSIATTGRQVEREKKEPRQSS